MTRDFEPGRPENARLTDDRIASLIRDAAESWQLPPVRLEQGGWGARVRMGRRRRFGAGIGAARRLGQGALVAGLLIVAGAAAGVWLTLPHTGAGVLGSSPSPVGSAPGGSPGPTGGAGSATVSRFLVRYETGYAVVDTEQGTVGRTIGGDEDGSLVQLLPDGTVACICLTSGDVPYGTSSWTVEWRHLDENGAVLDSRAITTVRGTPDPRSQAPDADENALVHVSLDHAGTAWVGWSWREHPVWHSGFVAVDVATGKILDWLALPDRDDGPADVPSVVDAPRIAGTIGADGLLIARPRYSWSPASSTTPAYQFGVDAFIARTESDGLPNARPFPVLGDCGGDIAVAGSRDDGGWWAGCSTEEGLRVERFDAQDASLGETSVTTTWFDAAQPDATVAVDPTGRSLFAWDPNALLLTRVDLATGETTSSGGSARAEDLMSRVGAWLAPAAAAKTLAMPVIAISPDGTRVYALGVGVDLSNQTEAVTSSGVSVFDASSLNLVAHWPATADYESIATNADGGSVFLAAAPTIGSQPPGCSITVLDASTGAVRQVVGGLGGQPFFFTAPRLP